MNSSVFSMGPYPVSVHNIFVSNRLRLGQALSAAAAAAEESKRKNGNGKNCSHNESAAFVVFLKGGSSSTRYDTDHEPLFRQESYFWWLSGVKEPDCAISIHYQMDANHQDAANTNDTTGTSSSISTPTTTATTTLYVPRLDADYATVMGTIRSLEEWKRMYLVDLVRYSDEITADLQHQLVASSFVVKNAPHEGIDITDDSKSSSERHKVPLMLLRGRNSDSGQMYEPPTAEYGFSLMENVTVDCDTLFPILAECRVTKSPAELLLMQHAAEITSFGHAYVMRNFGNANVHAAAPSTTTSTAIATATWEYHAESLFRHYCYYNYGARYTSYTSICGCGPDAAILHYGHAGEPNARQSSGHDICLFDMGAEYCGYGSDVTCSFPGSGTFTPQQSMVYQAVYNAQVAVYAMMRPGVSWVDCHRAAEKSILETLLGAGLVSLPVTNVDHIESSNNNTKPARTVDDLVEMRLGAVFMPHGLGHLIGIDTHDVGGYLPGHPSRSQLPGLVKLRTARNLQPNMVMTVEPGCYFIDHLLNAALAEDSPLRPYLNASAIDAYRGFGGVRLEDVVQVTDSGIVNYTLCPRTIHEVESVMAGGKWPPMHDEAPELRRVRLTETTPLPSPPSR